MKNVLIVDAERPFLLSLRDGLRCFDDQFNVILAGDGREAVKALQEQSVDLLVTDLKLPVMDGFQLLAHVSRFNPYLPVVVMTAFGTPEIEAHLTRLHALHYLEKPLDLDTLAETIRAALKTETPSLIRGITLATFLQLVHLEQKSCSLKIRSGNRTGYLFLRQGELVDAQVGSLRGEGAALQIVAWDETEIEMDNICRRKHREIESSLEFLLLEACRTRDEAARPEHPPAGLNPPLRTPAAAAAAAGKASWAEEPLFKTIGESPVVREFAVFDEAHFLELQSGDPGSLSKFDPSSCLGLGQKLGEQLGKGALRYLVFCTEHKARYLVFQHQRRRVVLSLDKNGQPGQLYDRLKEIRPGSG